MWGSSRINDFLARRPALGRLLANCSWLISERLVLLAAGFLVNIWFVRYLGPDRYGTFAYALSFAALFSALASAGMDTVVVRELTRSPGEDGAILGTALGIRIIAAMVAWTLASVAIFLARGDALARLLVIALAGQSIFTASGVFELWFQAKIAARGVVLVRTTVTLAFQAARCVLIAAHASLPAFAVLVLISAGLSVGGIAWLYVRSRAPGARLEFDRMRARAMMRDSWPLVIVSLSIVVYMKIDQVMLAAMSGDHENGIYATAVALSELWYFLPMSVAATVFPVIVKSRDRLAPDGFVLRMQAFYDGMALLSYSVALPVVVLATPIIVKMYGAPYAAAAGVLRVHVLSFVFVSLGVARGRYLVTENLTRFSMFATLLGATMNVALNVVLIPSFGATGAAWSTLLSYATANHLSSFVHPLVRRQGVLANRALVVFFRPSALRETLKPRSQLAQ